MDGINDGKEMSASRPTLVPFGSRDAGTVSRLIDGKYGCRTDGAIGEHRTERGRSLGDPRSTGAPDDQKTVPSVSNPATR